MAAVLACACAREPDTVSPKAEPRSLSVGGSAPQSACVGLGPQPSSCAEGDTGPQNVDGGALQACSMAPLTGWERDGYCRTGPRDSGVHVVCATMTAEFLSFTRTRGNDLSTPRPEIGFAGLSPGDNWCLCAARWHEALQAGVAPGVVREATHAAVARVFDPSLLP